jgi:oxalate decarboxylase/phosphoglucose isomerase-like protein (cupin superfamily)
VANIEGHSDVPLKEKMLAYIPPATRHNVTNNGTEVLEYVWVVAPASKIAKCVVADRLIPSTIGTKTHPSLERYSTIELKTFWGRLSPLTQFC